MAAGDRIYASDFSTGEAYFAERITSSAATVTAEVGYLRIDGMTLFAGRSYRFWTTPLSMKGSVVGDIVEMRYRFSAAGTAVVGSSFLNSTRSYVSSVAVAPQRIPLLHRYTPGANTTTASLLLTIVRQTAGGSSTGVQIVASATEPVQLIVEDTGKAQANVGVAL